MSQMVISGIEIEVIKKDIKNLHLAVYPPNGRVRIAAPLKMTEDVIRVFAISKLSWIKKQQRQFEEQPRQTSRNYISGESHYFKGTRYLLRVNTTTEKQKIEIKNKRYLDIYVRKNITPENKDKLVTEWYRSELKKEIPILIEKWEKITGLKVEQWGVKKMKTKWGTCNPNAKRIWLNLELAKKPIRCLEYIVVHEIIHLLERTHNDNFKALMDKFLPNWRNLKKELNDLIFDENKWDE